MAHEKERELFAFLETDDEPYIRALINIFKRLVPVNTWKKEGVKVEGLALRGLLKVCFSFAADDWVASLVVRQKRKQLVYVNADSANSTAPLTISCWKIKLKQGFKVGSTEADEINRWILSKLLPAFCAEAWKLKSAKKAASVQV